ncbi:MAG: methylase involved in ubiquinone/menaquinone biosynthesis [Amycolatopsis sp.]|jgi:SAM-dependent methyltransferase|uniref:class I SAM-dependent methyltransferase n=1 Tax=Amycolatopsis sp. TaxID=37632 RepID=UPI00262EF5DF|nr:class I SAM-dependent methyltransferase [Amycolatopsis sp.]MCU1686613.1 methylase involved in ubiquinone/menaquinone biosynthesis [Amycolatopsis sp.]
MSDLDRFQHPRFARLYERISAESEQRGTGEHRHRTLAGLTGRVIELGAGNGLNFTHYPNTVTEVVAVEPEDGLRALAEQAAHHTTVPVQVVAAHAGDLPFDDGSFDAAVASLVLCSVPDPRGALAELRRILTPTGELRFFEHVRSRRLLPGLLQDLGTPLWSRLGGGCHLNRDTAADIRAAGFTINEMARVVYAPMNFSPPQTHILGRATIGSW